MEFRNNVVIFYYYVTPSWKNIFNIEQYFKIFASQVIICRQNKHEYLKIIINSCNTLFYLSKANI